MSEKIKMTEIIAFMQKEKYEMQCEINKMLIDFMDRHNTDLIIKPQSHKEQKLKIGLSIEFKTLTEKSKNQTLV
jgi:hypothetical protein